MPFEHAHLLPIVTSVWFPITFIITYLAAVFNEDVHAVFPYISDTGSWSPESCFFGLMLNTGAILMAVTFYIRFRQVGEVAKTLKEATALGRLNQISMGLSAVAVMGVCIVANFQETNAFAVHVFGAFLAFGLGSMYQCLQTYISFRIYPKLGNRATNVGRACCALVSCLSFAVTFIFAGLALMQFKGSDPTKWSQEDGGFVHHFISAVAEWILAFATMLFIALFTTEFRQVSLGAPLFEVKV